MIDIKKKTRMIIIMYMKMTIRENIKNNMKIRESIKNNMKMKIRQSKC